ncbi:MAG: dihydrodipicolinate synthase family protein [Woeseia sp.]|jgi:4-hydroxy-tetrahydrodipicolinate synthase|nr:dihydrodipicolinate synthase family protein [Woeseia sp.]
MKFEGIIPPIITPFNPDRSVDEKGHAVVIEHMIDCGIHAIIVGGTTGEFYALSKEERIRQFAFARDVINKRVPLIVGVNDITTEGACEYAAAARDAGADGMLVAAPYYSVPTAKELASHCLAIDRSAGLPIILYNYPGRTGAEMSEEFLQRVGQRKNFAAIKEASGDIDRLHLLAREFPQIQLGCGADDQALEFFVWGATSWVTAIGNFLPKEMVAFYDTCVHENDFVKARALMSALLPVTTLLERGGKFVQCAKYGADYFGLPAGPVRKPLKPLNKELARQFREALDTAKVSIKAILAEDKPKTDKGVRHVRAVN